MPISTGQVQNLDRTEKLQNIWNKTDRTESRNKQIQNYSWKLQHPSPTISKTR